MPARSPALHALWSLLPLVVFQVAEGWWGTRVALVLSMALVVIDLVAARVWFGEVPKLTWLGAGLVLGLGGLSLLDDDPFWMLWSPVVGDVVLAGVLLVSVVAGRPLLLAAVAEQRADDPPDEAEAALLRGGTLTLAITLMLHGAAVAWTTTGSREAWLFASGPGQYVALGGWLALTAWQVRRLPPSDAPGPASPPGS